MRETGHILKKGHHVFRETCKQVQVSPKYLMHALSPQSRGNELNVEGRHESRKAAWSRVVGGTEGRHEERSTRWLESQDPAHTGLGGGMDFSRLNRAALQAPSQEEQV